MKNLLLLLLAALPVLSQKNGSSPLGSRKPFLLFTLVTALCINANAQDTLNPCIDDFHDWYHTGVNKIINDSVGRPSLLQVTTFPSFQAESGLRLVGTELYFVRLQSSFWEVSQNVDHDGNGHMDFSKPKIIPMIRHAPISAATARRVELVYSSAISKAKKTDWTGLDGVSYVFSTPTGACGWAWSPKTHSRNGQLVELINRLEKHAMLSSPIDLQRSEKSIMRYLHSVEDN